MASATRPTKLDVIAKVVRTHWPVAIHNDELQDPGLIRDIEAARAALLQTLGLTDLT